MYSTLGVVVGHELSHAFDPFGSQFDAWGSLHQWWKLPALEHLKHNFQCLANEYKAPSFCGNITNYGNQTLGEDTADLMGVSLAYHAWLEKRSAEVRDQEALDNDKALWFYSYSQSWCAKYSEQRACDRIKSDPHPLPRMRVKQTLRNIPDFARVMGCQDSDDMVHRPVCNIY
jgi:predicted metalloendopeptidase